VTNQALNDTASSHCFTQVVVMQSCSSWQCVHVSAYRTHYETL